MELLLFAHILKLFAQMMDGHTVQTEVVHPRPRQQHNTQQQGRGLPHREGAVADVASHSSISTATTDTRVTDLYKMGRNIYF